MRNLFGTCSLLLSTALVAQAPARVTLDAPMVASGACPVGFSARHANGGSLLAVSPATKPHGQPYEVAFAPGKSRAVVQARVTLHGMSGSHVIPAGTDVIENTTETFSIAPAGGVDHLFTSVVYARKLTAIRYIELRELTFADGTEWHASATSTCRVAPNGFLLVATE